MFLNDWKFLGLRIDKHLDWKSHINTLFNKYLQHIICIKKAQKLHFLALVEIASRISYTNKTRLLQHPI